MSYRAFPNGSHFLVQRDVTLTDDVVDDVFATHVLGHFAMVRMHDPRLDVKKCLIEDDIQFVAQVRWLLPELKRSKGRVIWTGSRAACRDALSIQPGVGGAPSLRDPYASAKCAQDLVSVCNLLLVL